MAETEEQRRIRKTLSGTHIPVWKRWGCFVSERMWGTVREDYSPDGDAWRCVTHDMARSKAYRWGEDGIAGWCDMYQLLIFSLAFWNGRDPILKERLFGVNPYEGNHGEDVKEYYFYLDATPTYSYTKFLYKYPHNGFPYEQLVAENQKRTPADREFELVDTGIFEGNRYFDIVVEYGKASPQDLCIRIEIFNRGEESASIHAIPQLLFRNRWRNGDECPEISEGPAGNSFVSLEANSDKASPPDWLTFDYRIPTMYLYGAPPEELLFTDNESNNELLYKQPNKSPYVKDAFHRYLIHQEPCVNLKKRGTKAAFHYGPIEIAGGESRVLLLRLTPDRLSAPLKDVEATIRKRKEEADEFYSAIQPANLSADEKMVQRQALAGMIWSVQSYCYNIKEWLDESNSPDRHKGRNSHWQHMHASSILSMPDKWEYPWFAAWDLSFHTLSLALVDIAFAKQQLYQLLKHNYQHPNGQIPAYEWGFSDTNPPVQAWALWELYRREMKSSGQGDTAYLEICFDKLANNFGWWVNRLDRSGNNFFEGGFLGLDNISIIDRSRPLEGGSHFEQSDGTGWMGFFALHMLRIALELAKTKPLYEEIAMVYLEHFFNISKAMQGTKNRELDFWDEEDGFFYDLLSDAQGNHQRLKVRSFVGLIPFCSVDWFDEEELKKFPHFFKHFQLFIKHHEKAIGRSITPLPRKDGGTRYIFSLTNPPQMRRVLRHVVDPAEFFSSYGLRSLSKVHEEHPFEFLGQKVSYEPGESLEYIKGGNSNWRGPIWFPTNYLFLSALRRIQVGLTDTTLPTHFEGHEGSTAQDAVYVGEVLKTLRQNLIQLFLHDRKGQRPIHGDNPLFQDDPLWKDLILFYEHFHGDTGRGLGASHQTGWTGLIANIIGDEF